MAASPRLLPGAHLIPGGTPTVPASLLLDPNLTPSAKLVWMVLRLHAAAPGKPGKIQARSGLSRPTVRRGIARLLATGWCARARTGPAAIQRPNPGEATATLPAALLASRQVRMRGKVLYGILQCTPDFRAGAGQCTHAGLSQLAGASIGAIKRAVRNLAGSGWIRAAQANQAASIQVVLDNPERAGMEREVARLEQGCGAGAIRARN